MHNRQEAQLPLAVGQGVAPAFQAALVLRAATARARMQVLYLRLPMHA